MATTFNGWPVLKHPGKGVFVAPNGKSVYCADNDVAEVFRYVAEQWHKRIEPLPKAAYNTYPNERKGYLVIHCSRPLGSGVGTGNLSNHVSHTAMDILGDKHHYEASCRTGACYGPQGRPHPWVKGFNTRQERELRAIRSELTRFAGGKQILRLGLDFAVGKRDGMHVEIAPGTTNADVARAAKSLRAARGSTPPPKPPRLDGKVEDYLTALGYPATAAGVRAYQTDRGLAVDGIPGKNTTAALEADMSTVKKVEADVADLKKHVTERTTVTLSDTAAGNLATGRTVHSLSQALSLIGSRVGRSDQRIHRLVSAVANTPALVWRALLPDGRGGQTQAQSYLRGGNQKAQNASAAARQGLALQEQVAQAQAAALAQAAAEVVAAVKANGTADAKAIEKAVTSALSTALSRVATTVTYVPEEAEELQDVTASVEADPVGDED